MTTIGATTVLGIVVASLLIYWLEPVGAGAIAFLVVLSLGVAGLLVKVVSWLLRKGDK